MTKLKKLYARRTQNIHPYTPVEPPQETARRLNLSEREIIKLDANENPYGFFKQNLEKNLHPERWHIYPDPAQRNIRALIANYVGCSPENIVAGCGADEMIDLTFRAFLNPGDEVLTFTPTFSYYEHVTLLNDGKYIPIPRNNLYKIETTALATINFSKIKIALLTSPNNPTGNLAQEDTLRFLLSQDIIVMVDEAYYEFSRKSYAPLISNHENLIVLRTFSKCFGMAGLRLGYGIMNEYVAQTMMSIKPPYSVSQVAEDILESALGQKQYFLDQVKEINQTKEWFFKQIVALPDIQAYPSESNFVLLRFQIVDVDYLWKSFEILGILVRRYASVDLKDCLRISIGTREQMEKFLTHLRRLIANF